MTRERKIKYLIYLAALMAGIILISNLAAGKLWDFFGIPVDGGVVVFPLSYILGDILVEFYGEKLSRQVVFAGFIVNMIAMAVFYIVIALPEYPGWGMQESFAAVLGFVPRIILGSLIAFVCSQLLNNRIFEKMRERKPEGKFAVRAAVSSLLSHLVDSAIFETIAFIGVLSLPEFFAQASFAYVAGIGLEMIMLPFSTLIVKRIRTRWPERVEI